MTYKQPLNLGRAAFGCCMSKELNKVFVAGGSINESQSTKTCEMYDIALNKWVFMPDLNEEKCS